MFIISISKGGDAISINGFHVGIGYMGMTFCNVHPLGLPDSAWDSDWIGIGQIFVNRVYVDF